MAHEEAEERLNQWLADARKIAAMVVLANRTGLVTKEQTAEIQQHLTNIEHLVAVVTEVWDWIQEPTPEVDKQRMFDILDQIDDPSLRLGLRNRIAEIWEQFDDRQDQPPHSEESGDPGQEAPDARSPQPPDSD